MKNKAFIFLLLFIYSCSTSDITINKSEKLISSIKNKNDSTFYNEIIDLFTNINYIDSNGITPLIYSVKQSNKKYVESLLNRGVDVNFRDKYNKNALYYAIENNNIDIVTLLLDKNSNTDFKEMEEGFSPLIYSTKNNNLEIVKLLLSKDSDVNIKDKYNNTPIMWAIRNNNKDLIKIILEKNPKLDYVNNKDDMAFNLALLSKDTSIIDLLIPKITSKDINEKSLLEAITNVKLNKKYYLHILDFIMESKPEFNNKIDYFLDKSISENSFELYDYFISKGANYSIFQTVTMGDIKRTKKLIDINPNIIHSKPPNDNTNLLMYSIFFEQYEMSKFLIEHGVNVKEKNILGYNIISILFSNFYNSDFTSSDYNNFINTLKLLLKNGVEFGNNYYFINNVLNMALVNGYKEILDILIDNNVKLDELKKEKDNLALINIINNINKDISKYQIYIDISRKLIDNNYDINFIDQEGNTALLYSIKEKNRDIFNLLMSKNVDINHKDKFGNTPIIYAIKNNDFEMVKALLDKGADLKIYDKNDSSVLDIAISYENKNIIELIKNN